MTIISLTRMYATSASRGGADWPTMPKPQFTVDTHIFRELGELLVGRDSTALSEMIKNSYDADASEIIVTAVELDHPDRARIVIQDNGCGMDAGQFKNGFLRIASRFKDDGERRSAHFSRRFTGSKGIGRLAAHKLAQVMDIESVSGTPGGKSKKAIKAQIDWKAIEAEKVLSDANNGIEFDDPTFRHPVPVGTTITLSELRRAWSPKERVEFTAECQAFQVPLILNAPLPGRILDRRLLFDTPTIRDGSNDDPGFSVRLRGDFAEGDDYWAALADETGWVMEIEAARGKREVRYVVAPTKATRRDYPEARRREFRHPHPFPDEGPFFQARVLVRDEQIRKDKALARWVRQTGGIRVYLEGFRVLPYGEPDDDWLQLNANAVRRSWTPSPGFGDLVENEEGGPPNWQQFASPNNSYTGAVFLTQANAPGLRMLVNREGFVADRDFQTLVNLLQLGHDLLTRTRAAAKYPELQRRKAERESARSDAHPQGSSNILLITEAASRLTATVQDVRNAIPTTAQFQAIHKQFESIQHIASEIASAAHSAGDAEAMLRVLASVGTQMASFVHEIRGMLSTVVAIHDKVATLKEDDGILGATRRRVIDVYTSLGNLRRQIERQAAYLVDVTAPDARRRRSRQKLAEQFDAAARLVNPAVARKNISLQNRIPPSLKSPPMFAAEVVSVFSNLLTNAVKAAGEDGQIIAQGRQLPAGGVVVQVENTGIAVDLDKAERWFRPFESTTTKVDATLGQGMGLGLTITRDILEQYGATIRFVAPSSKFKTAIEIQFPE